MAYAILRTAKLGSLGEIGGSLMHNYRTAPTPNADSERTHLNEHRGAQTKQDAETMIRARLPEKRRKDAVLCIEYMISASPEFFSEGEDGSRYFDDAIKWLEDLHGAENVITTTVHRDETSPHLIAYVVPIGDKGNLSARQFLGGKAKLSKMQTDFAKDVAQQYGLERGVEGSKATHTKVKEYYAGLNHPLKPQGTLSPEALDPLVLSKSFISGTKTETKEAQAKRLTKVIQDYYAPVLAEASTARLAQRRAKEMACTAQMHLDALKPLQELTEGLSQPQITSLMTYADDMRRSNALELKKAAKEKAQEERARAAAKAALEAKARAKAEAERRVAALKKVSNQYMTAGMTFGQMAIKAAGDDWKKVDWPKLEQDAIAALVENEWPADQALKAILDHSPDRASLTESEIAHELSQINRVKSTNKAAPDAPKRRDLTSN